MRLTVSIRRLTVYIARPEPRVVGTTGQRLMIVHVAKQGPPGADGQSTIQKVAGVALGGHRMVVLNDGGEAIYADSSTATHAHKVLGMTTGASSSGSTVMIRTYGEITEPSWVWTPDEPIYLGTTGLLTQVVPTDPSAFLLVVGFPISPTTVFIDIRESIIL